LLRVVIRTSSSANACLSLLNACLSTISRSWSVVSWSSAAVNSADRLSTVARRSCNSRSWSTNDWRTAANSLSRSDVIHLSDHKNAVRLRHRAS